MYMSAIYKSSYLYVLLALALIVCGFQIVVFKRTRFISSQWLLDSTFYNSLGSPIRVLQVSFKNSLGYN